MHETFLKIRRLKLIEIENLDQLKKTISVSFHPTFHAVYEKITKWLARFPNSIDKVIHQNLVIFYLLAAKKYLDHRTPAHLFRLNISIHAMQKKLLHSMTFSPHLRHLEVRWIPTKLIFPFSTKPVLGCLIGFNVLDRYELFDEENIILALKKYMPQLRLVKESSYHHTSQHKNLKMFYFEIEKKDGTPFSLIEQNLLKTNLEEKAKKSIQPLSPTVFMRHNDEENYKNILVLSQEIEEFTDIPQAYIAFDHQTGKEIVFRVILVYITPFHHFSLKEHFSNCKFVSERVRVVKYIENQPIEAHIFRIHLPRDSSFLRSDGSLNFYAARQKVATLISSAIGEFRDFNGGILDKQQEVLHEFKDNFPEITEKDSELIETFFYALTPLEKQVVVKVEVLSKLFSYFLKNHSSKLLKGSYLFEIYPDENETFIIVHADDSSLISPIATFMLEQSLIELDITYNFMETMEGVFFNCRISQDDKKSEASFIHSLQEILHEWHQKQENRQVLRIGCEYPLLSLDPRIGGDFPSSDVIRLLFEGLTRLNHENGQVEHGLAETIHISNDLKHYTFKLKNSFWNNNSPVSAYDFEYAWKKILSPDFHTSFAYLFYPIKNAKEAKEGKISPEEIGIHVIDDLTLEVELEHPAPYFLQLTAQTLYSPVYRAIDQKHPQWPYESEKHYPCNGPFQLKMNQPNQGYQLIKNNLYWDQQKIILDQITLSLMHPSQMMQAFQNNEIDWVGNPFAGWHPFFNPKKGSNVITSPNNFVCWCVFNTAMAPFHHLKLRQAFAYAIHRSKIISNAYIPLEPAFSPLLPHHQKISSSLFPDFNPEKGRELLEEALDELGIPKNNFSLTIIFYEKGIREHAALNLQQQFKECFDIECHLQPLSWNAMFNKVTQGDFQMGIIHWTNWIDDPIYTLDAFKFASEELNFPKWGNPHFRELLELSEKEIDPLKRLMLLAQAEEILNNEMPIIPLFYQPSQALAHKDLQVTMQSGIGRFNISRIFYKKNGRASNENDV